MLIELKATSMPARLTEEGKPSGFRPNRRQCPKTGAGNEKDVNHSKSFPSSAALAILVALSLAAGHLCVRPAEASSANLSAPNYLLYSSSSKSAGSEPANLRELLSDAQHNHASDRVNIGLANSVWALMHDQAEQFAGQRTREVRPAVNRLLEGAGVSSSCRNSLNDVLDRIAKLDNWAVQMYNSFGDFPAVGLFEGTRTSMGSYHQCVNLEPNAWIGRAQYCTFKFQPVVPKRPKYHNILAPIEQLANFSAETDMFRQLAKKAQYFYYTKLRLATCMPTKCEPLDLERLGRQIAINTYIQFAGVSCLEKEEGFNLDGAQVFALSVLLSLASISFLGTIVHLFDLRSWLVVGRAPSSSSPTDLTRTIKNHASILMEGEQPQSNQQHQQQQSLLNGDAKQQAEQLPLPTLGAGSSSSLEAQRSRGLRARLLKLLDFLIHFSIVKNGRKLFDTSTSRRPSETGQGREAARNGNEMNTLKQCSASGSSRSNSAVNGPSQSSDISCVHGLRFWTISWIILGHTMQYTEWAGFGRTHEIEQNITSFWLHPVLNATFSVDTFFLISGLLTTYVTWSITRGQYRHFNKFAFLISRYLRLTPQVLLVILLFIVFPLMGDGPYWRGLIQKESENCKRNWWVNALYLQSFVKQDQICNLVTWWLSIEMFYHFVSIFVIVALLKSTRKGLWASFAIGGALTTTSCYLHYANSYPPNMLPTLLQRYEIWDSIVLKYFWTPYPHAPSYFVGLLLGFVLYKRNLSGLSRFQVRLGWSLFALSYLAILFGTYNWNRNAPYSRLTSTLYYNCSQVLWSLATAWAIFACAMGHGGWLNRFLSSPLFVPLGRATYMTYLSHMIIVMSYPAKMNMLIEPSYVVFAYIFISNLFLSYSLGILLTLVYESPILHLQKTLVATMANRVIYNDNSDGLSSTSSSSGNSTKIIHHKLQPEMVKVSLMEDEQPQLQQQARPAAGNPPADSY